ncbi:MAG: ArsR/SmtB family transcription factor, partial [Bdellovibrionales bacterium]
MNVGPSLSRIAALIADPSRGKILASLMNLDGLPASELAMLAGITPQTASSHLGKMVAAGLLKLTQQGRHRYYSIASDEVANILERLAFLAPAPVIRTSKESLELRYLKFGRTCYGHLAGSVGVTLFERLMDGGYLRRRGDELELSRSGQNLFLELGLDVDALRKLRRTFACPCLDWTERKHHLAGALGKAITDMMIRQKWIRRL